LREARGDLWKYPEAIDALVITTNGYVTKAGKAVTGRGCAKQAAAEYPTLSLWLGDMLKNEGNHVHHCPLICGGSIVTFPVKMTKETCAVDKSNVVQHMKGKFFAGQKVPGWACKARLGLIEQSAKELKAMADEKGWTDVLMPRAGCGAGELSWTEVKPVLEAILDDRFIAITF